MSRILLAFCLSALLLLRATPSAGFAQSTQDRAAADLDAAVSIQAATRARLGVLGDAFTCPDARIVSFRRSNDEPEIADQWYVASQLWSDALLLRINTSSAPAPQQMPTGWDPQDARCYLDKGFVFLDRLWDYSSAGYFPRANPVGTMVDSGPRYADDNLIAGLALLETAGTTTDPAAKERYVHAARREADFLLTESNGLWDTTFGGGFWWNTGRGDTQEGKPAQTNALAALFFARLYAATDDANYRDWALRSLLWLDTILYDPSKHLYRWSASFQDLAHRTGALISQRYFNYDQSIAIEAQLADMNLDGDQSRLTRAEDIGRAIQSAFWSPDLGGYNLESGIQQMYTSYGAWTSLGDLALYDADADPSWLDLVTANVQALHAKLGEGDGGFAYRAYQCVDRVAKGCESGTVSQVVDRLRDTSAQAWAQHLEESLAERLIHGGEGVSTPSSP
jgi:hypothetical protein